MLVLCYEDISTMAVIIVIYDVFFCRVTEVSMVIMDYQGILVRKDSEGILVRRERKDRLAPLL